MPTKAKLGRLEKVSLSEAWLNEASDFTPWLAQKENLALLGETLNLELELEQQEKSVGLFRADILCKDTLTQNWVLIENQIARTDHSHLGQIITYAAGLKAVTIIWIAEHFTEEHRAALDWLNEMTAENINFFGLEIELWRIGESPLAPKFNIVSQPNNWTQTVATITRSIVAENLTETKQVQLEYWTEFYQCLHERSGPVKPTKPFPQHWMEFSVGKSNFVLSTTLNTREDRIDVALLLRGPNAKAHFHMLEAEKDVINGELGLDVDWRELPGKTESHIVVRKTSADPMDRSRWPEYQQWMAEKLELFHKVFNRRIKAIGQIG